MAEEKGGLQDRYNLERFIEAQEDSYPVAFLEISNGRKVTHWMWFIFPQLDGLGFSSTAEYYAIKSRAEAEAYVRHPVLGPRLLSCCAALMGVEGRSAASIFGFPDDAKLKSCMTLFSKVATDPTFFNQVLEKYFAGLPDERTLTILARMSV